MDSTETKIINMSLTGQSIIADSNGFTATMNVDGNVFAATATVVVRPEDLVTTRVWALRKEKHQESSSATLEMLLRLAHDAGFEQGYQSASALAVSAYQRHSSDGALSVVDEPVARELLEAAQSSSILVTQCVQTLLDIHKARTASS